MTEKATEMSVNEKMHKAYHLACNVGYCELTHEGRYLTAREDEESESDRVWGWVEGLVQKWENDRKNGRCSIQATIDFDVAEFEDSVDKDIAWFEKILKRVGNPKRLTKQEMRDRGYVVREEA